MTPRTKEGIYSTLLEEIRGFCRFHLLGNDVSFIVDSGGCQGINGVLPLTGPKYDEDLRGQLAAGLFK